MVGKIVAGFAVVVLVLLLVPVMQFSGAAWFFILVTIAVIVAVHYDVAEFAIGVGLIAFLVFAMG